jgi:cell division protease FtsH
MRAVPMGGREAFRGAAPERCVRCAGGRLNQFYKNMMVIAILMVVVLLLLHMLSGPHEDNRADWPYNRFVEQLKSDAITKVTVTTDGDSVRIEGEAREGAKFITRGPPDDPARLALLDEKRVETIYKREEKPSGWQIYLVNWIPLIVLVVIFFVLFRQIQGTGGRAMSFGKSRARLLSESQQRITFDDVAGVDEAKLELEEIVEFLRDPKKFTRLGGRIPKGVLLIGPPGTGKTLLARAIAGEAGVPFFSISGSDFVEMFVGVGASRVRDLFSQGKKNAPCIIFVDEIDAVGRHRGAGLGGGHDEREQTLNQLLVEMDGFESNEGVIIIAATNRPDVLDPAMLRPGRFDRHVFVGLPDLRGREAILRVHSRRVLLGSDIDLAVIARGTPGFSGADLENLVNEAALLAARRDGEWVSTHDLELAKDKVLMGSERRSLCLSEHERRVTAYHEGGHALMAMLESHCDPVHKVTMIPRGRALGVTMTMPVEDRYMLTKDQLLANIAYAMGGRAAEEVVFGHLSTGASNDLKQATDTARSMVCRYGMSDKIGPVSFDSEDSAVFLGRELGSAPKHSAATAEDIDIEISAILQERYVRAKGLLSESRHVLDAIAAGLLERETLDVSELKLLLEGRKLPPLPAPGVVHGSPPSSKEGRRRTIDVSLGDQAMPDPEPIPS